MIIEQLNLFPTRVIKINDFLDNNELEVFHRIVDSVPPTGTGIRNTGVRFRDHKQNLITDDLDFFYDKIVQLVKEYYSIDVVIYEGIYNHLMYGESLLFHHHFNRNYWNDPATRSLGVITGCYYTNTGEGFAKLRFNNPQLLTSFIGEPDEVNIQPDPNTLLIFPSWSMHGTTIHGNPVTRRAFVMEMATI
jgi:hypothetical protein